MMTGTIKMVKPEYKYGFIKVEGDEDVHFRFDKFSSPGLSADQITAGLKVSFKRIKGSKGFTAINITVTEAGSVKKKSPGRDLSTYLLPKDTRAALESDSGDQQIYNFHLLLNKYAFYDPKEKAFLLYRKGDKKKGIPGYQISPDFGKVPLKAILIRHRNALRGLNLQIEGPLTFSADWRLIVGLGNESVYETSMTLHHVYGIPYIPGQAVKGVVRSWVITERFDKDSEGKTDLKKAEKLALKDQAFCDIFGCPGESHYKQARQGNVIFFDAFPTSLTRESVQPDIMNPHYGPYYAGEKPPADYHNPVPVTFLTVMNTAFEFHIGIKSGQDGVFKGESLPDILGKALNEHGIGAKTAVGYGAFSL